MSTPELVDLGKFESRGSTIHTHYDGRHIQRKFYLENYSKADDVVEALLGTVTGGPSNWTRRFPAQYPGHPWCFCNEVRIEQIDPRAIAISPTLGLEALRPGVGDSEWRYKTFMHQVYAVPDRPAGGCFLTASYRPLLPARRPAPFVASPSDEEGAEEAWLQQEASKSWDWIDPHFTPEVKTVPWPDGLQVAIKPEATALLVAAIPDEVANPVSIPVIGFRIKRLLVGEVPWGILNALTNTVNEGPWPLAPELYTIPQFPKGTLRFNNFEVIDHYSPSASGGVWFELVLHFSWMSYRSTEVWNEEGICSKNQVADVGWNHVLMTPTVPTKELKEIFKLETPTLGWYFAMMVAKQKWVPKLLVGSVQLGPLYPFADFDWLFRLNP